MFDARAGIRRHDARQVPGVGEEKEDVLVWKGNPLHEFKPIRHAFSFAGTRYPQKFSERKRNPRRTNRKRTNGLNATSCGHHNSKLLDLALLKSTPRTHL